MKSRHRTSPFFDQKRSITDEVSPCPACDVRVYNGLRTDQGAIRWPSTSHPHHAHPSPALPGITLTWGALITTRSSGLQTSVAIPPTAAMSDPFQASRLLAADARTAGARAGRICSPCVPRGASSGCTRTSNAPILSCGCIYTFPGIPTHDILAALAWFLQEAHPENTRRTFR